MNMRGDVGEGLDFFYFYKSVSSLLEVIVYLYIVYLSIIACAAYRLRLHIIACVAYRLQLIHSSSDGFNN
jgi:hypothetical protein